MCTPQAALPKLKSQPQKLLASRNWISKYPASLIVDVIRKLLLVVNGPTRSGVRGQSVKSMAGLADCMLVNSACSSVKMVAVSVSSEGPAGTQYSAQIVDRKSTRLNSSHITISY